MTVLEIIIIAVIVIKVVIPWLENRNSNRRQLRDNLDFLQHEDLRDYFNRDH